MTARWLDVPHDDWLMLQRQLRGTLRQVEQDSQAAYASATSNTLASLPRATNVLAVDTTGGNVTVTLPMLNTVVGRTITIVKLTAANTLTVDPMGPTISGASTLAWTTAYQTFTLYATPTEWLIL